MNTPARRDGTPDRRTRSDQPGRGRPERGQRAAAARAAGRADSARRAGEDRDRRRERGDGDGRGSGTGRPAAGYGRGDGGSGRPVAGYGRRDDSYGRGDGGQAGRGGRADGGRPAGASGGRSAAAPDRRSDGGPRRDARPAARKPKPERQQSTNPRLSNAKPAKHQHVEEGGHTKLPWGEGERLQKVLAKAGVASRRAAEELIAQGRVEVDGAIVTEQGLRIDPENAVVRVDGTRVVVREELVHLALNKPRGWQSTMSDDLGRPCVGDIVAERVAAGQRLFHVGRLDADTEGLLLLTNDGDLAHRLMHPSYEVHKTYLATVRGEVDRSLGKRLRSGIELEDGPAGVDRFQVLEVNEGRSLVKLELHEGRKHIVRRLLAEVGHPVDRLLRTHVGPVALGDQRPGTLKVLGRDEIGKLYEAVQL
ncbi:pseudouridine synthase [Nocardia harenae]|uniref:pseudouridine synthase n=1 Tax=Nocardia harenae TaxID=358707 RepID=UPI000A029215|nr:pseudouridine synthase [Nocardia harenae]